MTTRQAIHIIFTNYPEKLFRVDILKNEVSKILGGVPDDFSNELRAFKDDEKNQVCMVPVFNNIRYIKSNLKYWRNKHNAYQKNKINNAKKRIKVA